MAVPPQKSPGQLSIELPSELIPAYANLARISHAPAEFVLDFARILPGDSKAVVAARIIMSPVALKLFVQAVNENLGRFEATFGTIAIPNSGSTLADSLFKPPNSPGTSPESPGEN